MAEIIGIGAVSVALGAVLYANLPTKYTLGHVVPTVKYLAEGKLRLVQSGKDIFTSKAVDVSCFLNF